MSYKILFAVLLSTVLLALGEEVIVCSYFEDDNCNEISKGFAGYKYGWEHSSKEVPVGCYKDEMSYNKITVADDKTKFFRKRFHLQNPTCDEKDYPVDEFVHLLNTCRSKHKCQLIDNSTSQVPPAVDQEFSLKIQRYLDKKMKHLNSTRTIPLYSCEEAEVVFQNSTSLYRFKEEVNITRAKIEKKFVKGKLNNGMTHVVMEFYHSNCQVEPFQTVRYFLNSMFAYCKFVLEIRKSSTSSNNLYTKAL